MAREKYLSNSHECVGHAFDTRGVVYRDADIKGKLGRSKKDNFTNRLWGVVLVQTDMVPKGMQSTVSRIVKILDYY